MRQASPALSQIQVAGSNYHSLAKLYCNKYERVRREGSRHTLLIKWWAPDFGCQDVCNGDSMLAGQSMQADVDSLSCNHCSETLLLQSQRWRLREQRVRMTDGIAVRVEPGLRWQLAKTHWLVQFLELTTCMTADVI